MSRALLSKPLRFLAQPVARVNLAAGATRAPTSPVATAYYHATAAAARQATLDADTISAITDREVRITGRDGPAAGGPTAQAQKHAGQPLTQDIISDVIQGERSLTGRTGPAPDGPAAMLQRMLDGGGGGDATTTTAATGQQQQQQQHTGKLDSATISSITDAERDITGREAPVSGGPTAQAQRHAGEPIGSENLHDITEGEKRITGETGAIKGGPTAAAQSELGKSRASSSSSSS